MTSPSPREVRTRWMGRGAMPRGGLFQFFGEIVAELRKAVWPSREEVVRLTYIVLIISGIIGFLLGVLDVGFTETITRYVFR